MRTMYGHILHSGQTLQTRLSAETSELAFLKNFFMQCEGKINRSTVGCCPQTFIMKIYFRNLVRSDFVTLYFCRPDNWISWAWKFKAGMGYSTFSCIINETSSVSIVSTWFTIVGIQRDFPVYKEWSFIFSICTHINAPEHEMSISTTNLKH